MLSVERLDDRVMPSITMANGVVTVTGSDAADGVNIAIAVVNGQIVNQVTHWVDGVTVEVANIPWGAATKFVVDLKGGNDTYYNSSYVGDEVHGGAGNDMLMGGPGGGELYGDAGDDWLDPGNCVYTGKETYLDGGAGADLIQCCYGPNVILYDPLDTVTGFNPAEDRFVY